MSTVNKFEINGQEVQFDEDCRYGKVLNIGIIEFNNDERKIKMLNDTGFMIYINDKFTTVSFDEMDYGLVNLNGGQYALVIDSNLNFKIVSFRELRPSYIIILIFRIKSWKIVENNMYEYLIEKILYSTAHEWYIIENREIVLNSSNSSIYDMRIHKQLYSYNTFIDDMLYAINPVQFTEGSYVAIDNNQYFISARNSNGFLYKYKVESSKDYILMTSWKSIYAADEIPLVAYFDKDSNLINYECLQNDNITTERLPFIITTPTDCEYVYINSRYIGAWPVLYSKDAVSLSWVNAPIREIKDHQIYYITEQKYIDVSNGRAYLYVIDNNRLYRISSTFNASSEGFAIVNFFDAQNNFIEGQYYKQGNNFNCKYSKLPINIPQNASYFVVNWRSYENEECPFPIVECSEMNNINNILHTLNSEEIQPYDILYNQGYYLIDDKFLNVSDAITKKYIVNENEEYFYYSEYKARDTGFCMITCTDADNNTIYYSDMATPNGIVRTGEYFKIPENTKYLYISSRYNNEYPVLKRYSSSVFNDKDNDNKFISIFFMGNSLTQDAVSYLPYLMKKLSPNVRFKFYIWYVGGATLSEIYNDFFLTNTPCSIFSVCEDNIKWENSSMTIDNILQTYDFDILCLQEYFNYKNEYTDNDLQVYNDIISYISSKYQQPFKVVTLFHQPKRDNAEFIYNLTLDSISRILKETITEDLIPAGISVYKAMSTELSSLGDAGNLSNDGTHTQEGLPCLMQAYVVYMWICEQIGIAKSIKNSEYTITTEIYNLINVPGPNLGTGVIEGTREQNLLAQDVAIKSYKDGTKIKFMSLIDN